MYNESYLFEIKIYVNIYIYLCDVIDVRLYETKAYIT